MNPAVECFERSSSVLKLPKIDLHRLIPFAWRDFWIFAGIFLCATGVCVFLHQVADTTDAFASPI